MIGFEVSIDKKELSGWIKIKVVDQNKEDKDSRCIGKFSIDIRYTIHS